MARLVPCARPRVPRRAGRGRCAPRRPHRGRRPVGPARRDRAALARRHPDSPDLPGTERTAEYREGLYVGYRYYTTADVPVAFPFGFGLSYTSFEHSDLVVAQDGVQVTVRNTGERAGADVVQVYVRRDSAGVHRPDRELKAFARVEVAAGESVVVTIPLDAKAFRHYDVESGAWQVEQGEYTVLVGAHVDDLRLSAPLTVRGTKPAGQPDPALPGYVSGRVQSVPDAEFAALLGRPRAAGPLDRRARSQRRPRTDGDRTQPARAPRPQGPDLAAAAQREEGHARPQHALPAQHALPGDREDDQRLVSTEMVDGIVRVVNGHLLTGGAATVRGLVRNLRANRRTARALRDAS